MLWIAFIVLAIAAIGGLTLVVAHIRQRPFPAPVGYLHGSIGLSGVIVLAIVVFSERQIMMAVNTSLLLFVLTLVGGLFLFLFRLQRELPPVFMMLLHGVVAVIGLGALWLGLSG